MASPSERITAWERAGSRIDVVGARVWTASLGPLDDATPVLVLHGFPTCSYDARLVIERTPARRFATGPSASTSSALPSPELAMTPPARRHFASASLFSL